MINVSALAALLALLPTPQAQAVAVSPALMAEEIVAARSDAASHVRHAVSRLEIRFEQEFRENRRYLDFEKAYPESIAQLRAAMKAEAQAIVRDEASSFNGPAAAFLARALTPDDLRIVWTFDQTSAGRRMAQASKAAALARLQEVTRDGGAFNTADMNAVRGAAVVGAAGAVREEDAEAMLRFARTPAAANYVQLGPEIDKIVKDSELGVVRRAGPRFAAAFKAVIDRRLAAK